MILAVHYRNRERAGDRLSPGFRIALTLLGGVRVHRRTPPGDKRGLTGPFLAIWLGGVAEAVATPGARAAEKVKGVGRATAAEPSARHVRSWYSNGLSVF